MKRICTVILSALCLVGCRHSDYNAILTQSEELMIEAPDSALSVLQTLSLPEVHPKFLRAKYALLYSQALDKNYIDVDNDSLIRVAVDYFENHGKYIDKAKAYYYLGVVHHNALDVDEAMKAFVKAGIYVDKTDDQYLRGLIYSRIGNLYYDQCSFADAVAMYSNAVDAFSAIGNKRNLLLTLHSKGLSLIYMRELQDAVECLTQAKMLAIELHEDSTLLSIVASLDGILIQTDTDPIFLSRTKIALFDTYKTHNQNIIPLEHYPIVGHIYYKENQIDSARYYCETYLDKISDITESNIGLFAILSAIEGESKNYKKALEYEKLFSFYTDSLSNMRRSDLIQNLERKYKTEYFQKSYEALQLKHKYSIISNILIISVILLILYLSVTTYKRSIKLKNQKIGEYEGYVNEVQNHYAELQDKYEGLIKNVNVQDIQSEALFGILGNRIRSLQSVLDFASKYGSDSGQFYTQVKDYLKVTSGKNPELASDVIAIANLSCYGIITKMEELYPSLSQHELCYCGFICLGFSPESIRILYNHTNTDSLYTMRSKIRGKLGVINNSFNLETHICDLMEKLKEERIS